jgi:hypothetical protein
VVEVPVLLHDTVYVTLPVPATVHEAQNSFPIDNPVDFFVVEDSTAFAEIKMEVDTVGKRRNYNVKVGRKESSVSGNVPISCTDTVYVQCPPCNCPTLPASEPGKFPWALVLTSLAAVVLFFTVGKRKGESVR